MELGKLPPTEGVVPALLEEADEFEQMMERYFRLEITADEFRRFRVMRGIYGQRQPGYHMVRVKLPFGRVTATQLRRLGEIAAKHSNHVGHVTTRQDIQFHFVELQDVPTVMRKLAEVGLTTREACGSTVRNVTACPLAGVCPHELFDVTPYAAAVARYLLRHPLVQRLPRKFKIAFSGCLDDCAMAGINDIGLIATAQPPQNAECGMRNADLTASEHGTRNTKHETRNTKHEIQLGFRVLVGGGLGASPEAAHLLLDFITPDELIPTCEAILKVFDREGDRKHKMRARLKFVIRRLGMEKFKEEFEKERAKLPATAPIEPAAFRFQEIPPSLGNWEIGKLGKAIAEDFPATQLPSFLLWRQTNVIAQRQAGYCAVFIKLVNGNITASQFHLLADIAERFSNGVVRTTHGQDVMLRWVKESSLPALYGALQDGGFAAPGARHICDTVACPGAYSCAHGITHSQGLAKALSEALESEAGADDLVGTTIKISGCPDSCGHHHIATIGFYGGAGKVDGKQVPRYRMLLGGGVDANDVQFGRPVADIPACRVVEAVQRLIAFYRQNRTDTEPFTAFVRRLTKEQVQQLLADLLELKPRSPAEKLFVDVGTAEEFRVETGEGECAV